jgi:hypothetical protein
VVLGIATSVPLKDSRDPHLKNIEPLRDTDSVNNQPGGAYLMRSATPDEVPTRLAGAGKVELKVVRGRGLTEVHQQFGSYASQIVRVREGSAVVELGECDPDFCNRFNVILKLKNIILILL